MLHRILISRRAAAPLCRAARGVHAFQYSSVPNEQKDHYYDRRDRLGKIDDDFVTSVFYAVFTKYNCEEEDTNRVEWTTQDNFLTVF